jgi:hypothetical protein
MTMRYTRNETLAPRGATMRAGHVRLGPSLVDEDQAGRVDALLVAMPALAFASNVGPFLFSGVQAFF